MGRAEFYEALGHQLRNRRRELRLTQEQLGSRLRPPVTRASIANIEAGKQGVLAHTLVDLALALETTASEFLPSHLDTEPEAPAQLFREELARKVPDASESVKRRLTSSTKGERL